MYTLFAATLMRNTDSCTVFNNLSRSVRRRRRGGGGEGGGGEEEEAAASSLVLEKREKMHVPGMLSAPLRQSTYERVGIFPLAK